MVAFTRSVADDPAPRPAPMKRELHVKRELHAVRIFIEENYAERMTLEGLAAIAGLSVFRFVTVFRRQFGVAPYRFLSMVRVEAAKRLLLAGTPPAITAIEVGFCDQSHLCRHFRSLCGLTPGQFLAGHYLPPASRFPSHPAPVLPAGAFQ